MTEPATSTETVDEAPPPPPEPWTGDLPALLDRLMHASYRMRGGWAFYPFPVDGLGSVNVAMRVVPDTFSREIAVTLAGEPDVEAWRAFVARVNEAADAMDSRLQRWIAGPIKRSDKGVSQKLNPVMPA